MLLASRPHICLAGSISLTASLATDGAMSKAEDVAFGLSG